MDIHTELKQSLKEMIPSVKGLFQKILSPIKGAKSSPFAVRYAVFSVILFILFLLFLFPYDAIILSRIEAMDKRLYQSLDIQNFIIGPFRDWSASSISYTSTQHAEITLTNPIANISTFSLLGGAIHGDITIENIRYQKDNLQSSLALRILPDITFDKASLTPTSGTISLTIDSFTIRGLVLQGFTIPPVKIPSIKGSGTIQSRVLTINNCTISGTDLNGIIRGTITFDPIMSRSIMALTIEISAESTILSEYKPLLSSFINPGTGRLSIVIQGAFVNPAVNMLPANPEAVQQ